MSTRLCCVPRRCLLHPRAHHRRARTIAARDAIALSGGPFFPVKLGRLDGLSSSASNVASKLLQPTNTLNQLVAIFRANGLAMFDMVALSEAHSVGLAHCSKFSDHLYRYKPPAQPMDPTLNEKYAAFLKEKCPDGGPDMMVLMDQATPALFDNQYYRNLQDGGGLLASDELLYTDNRTRPLVNSWAARTDAFNRALPTPSSSSAASGSSPAARATSASSATSSTDRGMDRRLVIGLLRALSFVTGLMANRL
ncbi:hypothetical protein ABZP36_019702 [Zizania latifolia]